MLFYLEEKSKTHNQVRRWQKVLLSWRETDEMLGPESDVIRALTLLTLQNAFKCLHTSDHKTSSGQVLSSGSCLRHLNKNKRYNTADNKNNNKYWQHFVS